MDSRINNGDRRGMALITVLLIVITVTVLSLGFLSRSDVELACGENMVLKGQMDYLAESGLEHARGLILNPQDVNTEYWTGDVGQQIAAGDDYYDVSVDMNDSDSANRCNYNIVSEAYRLRGGERLGRSRLLAELRIDPCIALWVGSSWASEAQTTVNGDVYCSGGNITGTADINGDAFASGDITATNVLGKKNRNVAQAPVAWPGLEVGNFSSNYYAGSTNYSVVVVDSNVLSAVSFFATEANPAGVRYRGSDLVLAGGVNINGMLVVDGTLRVTGADNVITAVKSFPALLVSGEVVMESGGTLEVNGLAQIGQKIVFNGGADNAHITVVGGLFVGGGDIDGLTSALSSVNVTAAPDKASIEIWPTAGNAVRWSQAGGAFFRRISRK